MNRRKKRRQIYSVCKDADPFVIIKIEWETNKSESRIKPDSFIFWGEIKNELCEVFEYSDYCLKLLSSRQTNEFCFMIVNKRRLHVRTECCV